MGFFKDDIILVISHNPYILLYSIETLKDKFLSIQSLGYSSSDVVKMIQGCPFLFGYHIKSIEEKIEFYKECGLGSLIVDESKFLFYNLNFIKSRYQFISKYEKISMKNYFLLFLNDSDFYNKYSITKEELLKGDY